MPKRVAAAAVLEMEAVRLDDDELDIEPTLAPAAASTMAARVLSQNRNAADSADRAAGVATDGAGDGESTSVALLRDQLLEARDVIMKLEEEKLRAADEISTMKQEIMTLEEEKLRELLEKSALEQELRDVITKLEADKREYQQRLLGISENLDSADPALDRADDTECPATSRQIVFLQAAARGHVGRRIFRARCNQVTAELMGVVADIAAAESGPTADDQNSSNTEKSLDPVLE
jgi:chromosome segregation ATPase